MIIRFYTVFWDGTDGVPDDKSFNRREDAEAFYEALNVPYKKLQYSTYTKDVDVKSEMWENWYE